MTRWSSLVRKLPLVAGRTMLSVVAAMLARCFLDADTIYFSFLHDRGAPVDASIRTFVMWGVHLAPLVLFLIMLVVLEGFRRKVLTLTFGRRVSLRASYPLPSALASHTDRIVRRG